MIVDIVRSCLDRSRADVDGMQGTLTVLVGDRDAGRSPFVGAELAVARHVTMVVDRERYEVRYALELVLLAPDRALQAARADRRIVDSHDLPAIIDRSRLEVRQPDGCASARV